MAGSLLVACWLGSLAVYTPIDDWPWRFCCWFSADSPADSRAVRCTLCIDFGFPLAGLSCVFGWCVWLFLGWLLFLDLAGFSCCRLELDTASIYFVYKTGVAIVRWSA